MRSLVPVALFVITLSSDGAMAAEYLIRPEQSELVALVFKTGFAAAPAGFLVTGDFTLRGTTRRISFPVATHLAGDALRATGAFDFNQSDFGITPVSLFLGAVRNQDRIRVVFGLVAAP